MGYQGEGLSRVLKGMVNIALDMAEERLREGEGYDQTQFLRRVMNMGSEEDAKAAEEYKRKTGGRSESRKMRQELKRESPGAEEAEVVDVEWVEVKKDG